MEQYSWKPFTSSEHDEVPAVDNFAQTEWNIKLVFEAV
jgi:hypothetical protein